MSPPPAPPLTLTLSFSGHRAVADHAAAGDRIGEAFAAAAEAIGQAQAPLAAAYDGAASLRLICGDAPGADRLAARVWRGAGLGAIHRLYPFRDPDEPRLARTADPADHEPDTTVEPPADEPWTGFDAASLGLRGNAAHAQVARWIVRRADLLVAWWDGRPGAGEGGTGDTVRHALDRGVPVIWVATGGPTQLIEPLDAADRGGAPEDRIGPLDPATLAARLGPVLAPPRDTRRAARPSAGPSASTVALPPPPAAFADQPGFRRLARAAAGVIEPASAARLRAALATWPLGFDIDDGRNAAAADHTEWRARAWVRAAEPPSGWITRAYVTEALCWSEAALRGAALRDNARPQLDAALAEIGRAPYLAATEALRRAATIVAAG